MTQSPIAVIGMAALFPGSTAPDGFWRTIVSGQDCITGIPETHWLISDYYDPNPEKPGKTYARRGAFLSPTSFDPLEHGIPPNQLPSTDTAQLLALLIAKRLLETSCGLQFRNIDRERISVILGVASATELVATMAGSLQHPVVAEALRAAGISNEQTEQICKHFSGSYADWTESTFPGLLGNVVAGRIANRFDLGGTNCVLDAACASSLAAVQMAMQELWCGAADMVITGGVDALNDILMFMCFSKTQAMSKSGDCRPFSADADGTMLGEGIGMFALRRLEDAEHDGDRIYAVFRGIGASSDGRAKSIYAPRPEGQARALRRAYAAADYGPETVGLVEAHGTGTMAGDAAEFAALREVFLNVNPANRQCCALGSVKSQIGHTKAAAGSASLYKAVMALHHKVLPPTIKVTAPNPALQLDDSPFYLNTKTRPWIHGGDHPRRASVSAFGFGGSNFHLTLEEYRGAGAPPPRILTRSSELFLISAASGAATIEAGREIAAHAQSKFPAAARDSQEAFAPASNCRLAIVATDARDLSEKMGRAEAAIRKDAVFCLPPTITFSSGAPLAGGVAFLFPGQGSQHLEMGAEVVMAFGQALSMWDRAAAQLPGLPAIVFPPPAFSEDERRRQELRLVATENAQPAIGITSALYLNLLRAAGVEADYSAGHSFGEVTALFASGIISETDFLAIARERGRLMQEAAGGSSGAMLAVAAGAAEVSTFLSDGLTLANVNSPHQVVLAGPVGEIERAERDLAGHGITTRRLPVSTAFHSPIVESAAPKFTAFLKAISFQPPRSPVFANSTAAPYPDDAAAASELLGNQLALPVRFADQVEALYGAGARCFIEVGPGSVLTDLTSACLAGRAHWAVATNAFGRDSLSQFWFALGRLATAGVPIETAFAWRGVETQPAAEVSPSATALLIAGANYGKKYPRKPDISGQLAVPSRPTTEGSTPPSVSQHTDAQLASIEQIHRQMAETHAATQRAMSDAHIAYLRASEAAFARLGVFGSDEPTGIQSALSLPDPARIETSPVVSTKSETKAVANEFLTPPASPAHAESPLRNESLTELVLNVVAEKTGYPRDVLRLDMDLEADLGIDSIKRVQILSAVSLERPDLPQADGQAMAGLRTLKAIIDHLSGSIAPVSVAIRLPQHLTVNGLARLGIRSVEVPRQRAGKTPAQMGCTAIIGSPQDELAGAIAANLRGRGITVNPNGDVPVDTGTVIFVDSPDPKDHFLDERALRAFDAAQRFAARCGSTGGGFITIEPRSTALLGGLAALVKTVALEYPACSARAIAIEAGVGTPKETAKLIAEEILSGTQRLQVAFGKGGECWALEDVPLPIGHNPDTRLLTGRPVIVVAGGARGVTAACLTALAETAPVRLALLGRTRLDQEPRAGEAATSEADLRSSILRAAERQHEEISPREAGERARRVLAAREVRGTLKRLRELGAEVEYFCLDVTDAAAVSEAFAAIRKRWSRIDGLIHAAGVIADNALAKKTAEQFAAVFGTKVRGFASLLEAATSDDLRFMYVFTSVAGRCGNSGQADYAMANATVSQMARSESARRPDCVVRALSWGPWQGGMVTPELQAHFAARGIPLIPMDRGVAAFVQELCHTNTDPVGMDVVLAAEMPPRSVVQ